MPADKNTFKIADLTPEKRSFLLEGYRNKKSNIDAIADGTEALFVRNRTKTPIGAAVEYLVTRNVPKQTYLYHHNKTVLDILNPERAENSTLKQLRKLAIDDPSSQPIYGHILANFVLWTIAFLVIGIASSAFISFALVETGLIGQPATLFSFIGESAFQQGIIPGVAVGSAIGIGIGLNSGYDSRNNMKSVIEKANRDARQMLVDLNQDYNARELSELIKAEREINIKQQAYIENLVKEKENLRQLYDENKKRINQLEGDISKEGKVNIDQQRELNQVQQENARLVKLFKESDQELAKANKLLEEQGKALAQETHRNVEQQQNIDKNAADIAKIIKNQRSNFSNASRSLSTSSELTR